LPTPTGRVVRWVETPNGAFSKLTLPFVESEQPGAEINYYISNNVCENSFQKRLIQNITRNATK
jgi:hypothetical protein